MPRFFKLGTWITAITLTLQLAVPASSNAGVVISPDVPTLGIYMHDNMELNTMPSQIFGVGNPNDDSTILMCASNTSAVCQQDSQIFVIDNFEYCQPNSQGSCISDVWAVDSSGNKIQAQFVKAVQSNTGQNLEENSAINLPPSHGMGFIVKLLGVTNSLGSDEYYVALQERLGGNKAVGANVDAAVLHHESFVSGIAPIKEVAGNYAILKGADASTGNGAWGSNPINGPTQTSDGTQCWITDATYCGIAGNFPSGYRFGMSIRLKEKLTGWFNGRLGLPQVTTQNWNNGEEISIEGAPLLVPSLDFSVPNSQIPAAARPLIFNGKDWGIGGGGKKGEQLTSAQGDPAIRNLITAFAPAFGDKATEDSTIWSFKTLTDAQSVFSSIECSNLTKDVAGIVTTNALTYSDGYPDYDPTSGTLKYIVEAPHFASDGTVAQGTYDLAMRSDLVRCLYNFSKAPIQASVSIQSTDGDNQVATTVVGEKNGWLYLSAKGFTFSNPTISVKLSQDAPAASPPPAAPTTASPTVAPSPTRSPVQSKPIVCVKGKAQKVVKNASCPSGYKRK